MTSRKMTQEAAGRIGAANPGTSQARRVQRAADRNDAEAERQLREREAAEQKAAGSSSSSDKSSGSNNARRQGR
ncbi:hypothetical protein PVAG01_02962 [Phlyctema vagabunda]|uniref:Uncharacterized protein n=1 Tax=Phlyctema vagabunda TaxID=108571 RepID=A0ABR4PTF9_9HELO